jgi:hypothetical protein
MTRKTQHTAQRERQKNSAGAVEEEKKAQCNAMQSNGVGIWDTENGLFFFCYLGVENTEINLNIRRVVSQSDQHRVVFCYVT